MKDSRYNAGMWNYHPDLLMRAVPRYTSYPTAAEFAETVGAAEQASALQRVGMGDAVSLYVHIPFCQEICWYCGCNTGRANRTQRLEAYLEALRTEIATTAAMLNGRGHISRIAFGGGSPNALAPAEFTALVETLRETFSARDAALSIEIDPRSFTPQWAAALAIAGATKASLGVQTFDPAIQMAIGRVQDSELIARSVQSMRANGVDSINFDLMYGLPGQDEASLLATIEEAMTLRPERIALFGYAHVPHLLPRQRRINAERLPDQAERFAMAQLGHDRLVAEGYQPVGFDHFALPDDELASAARAGTLRRNFQGFTEDQAKTLIGLGASAISQFPDLLVQNEKNSGRYRMRALAGQLTGERGIARDREDRLRADAIESLLCERAIALDALPAQAEMIASLQPFIARGLATLAHGMLEISPEGRPYGRVIAAIFDRYRAEQPRRFSTAI